MLKIFVITVILIGTTLPVLAQDKEPITRKDFQLLLDAKVSGKNIAKLMKERKIKGSQKDIDLMILGLRGLKVPDSTIENIAVIRNPKSKLQNLNEQLKDLQNEIMLSKITMKKYQSKLKNLNHQLDSLKTRVTTTDVHSTWKSKDSWVEFGSIMDRGLAFLVNKDRKMFIDKNGNVGIEVKPQSKLHMQSVKHSIGTLESLGNVDKKESETQANWYYKIANAQWFSGIGFNSYGKKSNFVIGTDHPIQESKLVITTDGKIGVGTINPQAALHVNGNVKAKNIDNHEQRISSIEQQLADFHRRLSEREKFPITQIKTITCNDSGQFAIRMNCKKGRKLIIFWNCALNGVYFDTVIKVDNESIGAIQIEGENGQRKGSSTTGGHAVYQVKKDGNYLVTVHFATIIEFMGKKRYIWFNQAFKENGTLTVIEVGR